MSISFLIILPLIGASLLFFIKPNDIFIIKFISLFVSMVTFFFSIFLWVKFDKSTGYFQFSEIFLWGPYEIFFGVDGISLFFILLSTFLIPLCILSNWYNIVNFKVYSICFLIIESFLIILFSTLNLLVFFLFFESVLIPLFILIGFFGSGRRKVRSGYFFFFLYVYWFYFNAIKYWFYLFKYWDIELSNFNINYL